MAPMDDFCGLLDSTMVTVEIGPGVLSKSFKAPKSLLCILPWFDSALKHDAFKEGLDGRVTLPEDPPTMASPLCQYVYRQTLSFKRPCELSMTEKVAEVCFCIDIWLFGDKYGVPTMQNISMLHMCQVLRELEKESEGSWTIPADVLAHCFTRTMLGSPLRKIATDVVVRQMYVAAGRPPIVTPFPDTLRACDGFVEEILASQHLCLQGNAADFPRYTKPQKFITDLRLDEPESKDDWEYHGYFGADLRCCECDNESIDLACKGVSVVRFGLHMRGLHKRPMGIMCYLTQSSGEWQMSSGRWSSSLS